MHVHMTPNIINQLAHKNTSPRTCITQHIKQLAIITNYSYQYTSINHINISYLITIPNINNNITLRLAVTSKGRTPPWARQPVYGL